MISSDFILIFPIVKHWGFLLITLHFSACFHNSTTCLQEILSSSSSQGRTAIYTVTSIPFHNHLRNFLCFYYSFTYLHFFP